MARLAAITTLAALSACSLPAPPKDHASRQVAVDGHRYTVSPLTAATWTATPVGPAAPPTGELHRQAVIRAVESASGCKVTDSDYSPDRRQLDTQVDCGSASN